MQQVAVFRGEQENQPVDETQELAEKLRQRQRARMQLFAQRRIVWVRQEAIAEAQQRGLNAIAQLVARGDAFLLAGIAPAFEGAVRWRGSGKAETAGMDEQPQRCEVREGIAFEDAPKIGLDIGRARKAGIVAHQPKLRAIGAQAPERTFAGIQPVLQCGGRRAPPPVRRSGACWVGRDRPWAGPPRPERARRGLPA